MNEIGSWNNNEIKSGNLHLYGLMVELIIEHEGHINEKQRKILDKKIKEWQLRHIGSTGYRRRKRKEKKII
jgi:hypothetical protein